MNEDPVMSDKTVESQDVTPKDLLRFAKSILSVIGILSVFGSLTEMIFPQNNIFATLREILPPMATMVMGFYFGKAH